MTHAIPTLRDYQAEDEERMRRAYRDGVRRLLYCLPTGGGKTITFAHILHGALRKNRKMAVVVHRVELVRQVAAALKLFGVPFGVIAPGFKGCDAPVQIAMVQTLVRRMQRYTFDFIVFDECHHIVANTYQRIIEHYKNARILGVTATPCRLTKSAVGLGDVFEHMILGPSVSDLIMQGYLSRFRLFSTGQLNRESLHVERGDFARVEVDAEVRQRAVIGDLVEHYRGLCNGMPAIAFAHSVAHAREIEEQFRFAGYSAATVEGAQNEVDRAAVVQSFSRGQTQILCSCDVVSEGFDVPGVVAILGARPTKSLALCLQQWGRGLRVCEGKNEAYILDHVGNYHDHGFPDDERGWTLEHGATLTPKKDRVVACPSCNLVQPRTGRCEACGYTWPRADRDRGIETADGVLVEVSAAAEAALKEEIKAAARNAKSLTEMHAVAKKYGKSPGWAWMQWKIKQQYSRRPGEQTVIEEPERAVSYA